MLIDRLHRQTGLERSQLEHFAKTASKRYKTYPIKKRSGEDRIISQPTPEIKSIQRWLVRVLFRNLPVHHSSTAYSRGSSIRENASRHKDFRFTVRVDFRDFFPSFKTAGLDAFLRAANRAYDVGLEEEDFEFVSLICLRHGALTIGAPSSPMISNLLMHEFDSKLSFWCANSECIYSRYADDIFISTNTPNILQRAVEFLKKMSNDYRYADLRINDEKTVFLSKKYKRSITGLIVTPQGDVSIGRDRKRKIRSMLHRYQVGKLGEAELGVLQGLIAFASDAEPRFHRALALKFGDKFLDELKFA